VDNKHKKLFVIKHSKWCKFMPKMHQNHVCWLDIVFVKRPAPGFKLQQPRRCPVTLFVSIVGLTFVLDRGPMSCGVAVIEISALACGRATSTRGLRIRLHAEPTPHTHTHTQFHQPRNARNVSDSKQETVGQTAANSKPIYCNS